MFCTKCGNQISEGEQFCTVCGEPVPQSAVSSENVPDEPKKHSGTIPIIISAVAFVIIFAVIIFVGGYDLVKTKEFKENITAFEEVQTQSASLGKYKSDYEGILGDANNAASHYAFWKYEALTDRMDSVSGEIRQMNALVAEYREQYDQVVKEIETDGHYVMDDYQDDYQSIKTDFEKALEDFDEKECKKNAGDFADIRDDIVEGNEKTASEYLEEAKDIQSDYNIYDAHPFEKYMVGDCVSRIEEDSKAKDYIKLSEDYSSLKEWADRFNAASSSQEQITGFVQADVSESDRVKLYLSTYEYEEYKFLLEDFLIYEKNGEVWDECQAVDISQIKGLLTMDLVVDVSSSMSRDFYTMQGAVEGFVDSTHSDTVLGLSTIGSIYERHQEFTQDKDAIVNSVWNLDCYGLTSLYQSLYSSVIYTASSEGARCVVAFTDGHNEPYGSGYDYSAQDVIDVSNYYQVPVYIIGIGSGVYSSELRNIAESTGGAYYDRVSINDLQNVYADIYEAQGRLYQLSYKTTVPNNVDRDLYVLYSDDSHGLSVRFESELNASALQEAYETAGFSANDLTSFYTDSKYLSSDDLSKLGDDLEAVQTVINIYFAKHDYQFGDGENGQKQLAKMISLGVITENGSLNGDEVTAILKQNPVLYQNFSALFNYRYELVYSAAYDIYWNNPSISYEDLRQQVHQHYGEENEKRFDPVTKAAWNAIKAG